MKQHWYGKFKSSIIFAVYGKMDTDLPIVFTNVKSQSKITLRYEGMYEITQFDIENWLNENNTLQIDIKNNGEFQSIKYTVSSFFPKEIKGTYQTFGPYGELYYRSGRRTGTGIKFLVFLYNLLIYILFSYYKI